MIGIGAANLAAGFFQGFPVSTSGSRTAIAEQAGARTQVTGLVGAVTITLMLLLVPGALRNLPQPTLAAVVIAASLSLADIGGTVRLWRQRPTEFALSITAFAGVALLGVLPGIAIVVALSIGNVFRHAWWPYQTVLGRVAGLPGYHDVRSYPDAELVPGCVLFRFDGPLFFANTRTSRRTSIPRSRRPWRPTRPSPAPTGPPPRPAGQVTRHLASVASHPFGRMSGGPGRAIPVAGGGDPRPPCGRIWPF
jgi:MFS superfamily sulfate permease-like transporter